MPFKKGENASAAGKKGGLASGRWKGKDPSTSRNVNILLKVSPTEADMIKSKADKAGLSRVELVVRAVKNYDNKD